MMLEGGQGQCTPLDYILGKWEPMEEFKRGRHDLNIICTLD